MSVLGLLAAERIKLTSTRWPLWSLIGVAMPSLGLAALRGTTAYDYSVLSPQEAVLGVVAFGVPVLMILSALTVTAEYRSGMIDVTFLATPRRTRTIAAKAVVAAVFCGICAAAVAFVAVAVTKATATPLAAAQLSLTGADTWRLVAGIAGYAVLAAVLGVAVGTLVRSTAGAVAVLLLWPLVAEPILANLPRVSTEVGPYLPFGNVFRFLDVTWLYPVYHMPWSAVGSLVYFGAVAAVVFVAATVVVNRRDAGGG